jgi:hypothetical protein
MASKTPTRRYRGYKLLLFAALPLFTAIASAQAAGADGGCKVRSDYDFTLSDSAVVFERIPAPLQQFEMKNGSLSVNGKPVTLNARDRGRIASFEATLRGLVPKIKAIAQRAVDLSVVAIREEAASASPKSAADPQLNRRLDARAAELRTRIAASSTSKQWRGPALNRYSAEVLSDVLPIVGGDLAQQAVEVALRGDLAGASALKNRAMGLRAALEARIRRKLDVLQPELDKLCPSLRRLNTLESGLAAALPDGSRLNLLEVRS